MGAPRLLSRSAVSRRQSTGGARQSRPTRRDLLARATGRSSSAGSESRAPAPLVWPLLRRARWPRRWRWPGFPRARWPWPASAGKTQASGPADQRAARVAVIHGVETSPSSSGSASSHSARCQGGTQVSGCGNGSTHRSGGALQPDARPHSSGAGPLKLACWRCACAPVPTAGLCRTPRAVITTTTAWRSRRQPVVWSGSLIHRAALIIDVRIDTANDFSRTRRSLVFRPRRTGDKHGCGAISK